MVRKAAAAIVLAAMLLTAGCSTNNPVGPETTQGPDIDPSNLPDGVSTDGINSKTIADNHKQALQGESVTLSVSLSQSAGGRSQTAEFQERSTANRDRIWFNGNFGQQLQEMYLTPNRIHAKSTAGNRTQYNVQNRTNSRRQVLPVTATGSRFINTTLSSGDNFTVANKSEQGETTFYVLNSTSISGDLPNINTQNVSEFRSSAVIDEHGVVHSLSYHVEFQRGDRSAATTATFELSNVGSTTVPKPDWLDEARNSSSTRQ